MSILCSIFSPSCLTVCCYFDLYVLHKNSVFVHCILALLPLFSKNKKYVITNFRANFTTTLSWINGRSILKPMHRWKKRDTVLSIPHFDNTHFPAQYTRIVQEDCTTFFCVLHKCKIIIMKESYLIGFYFFDFRWNIWFQFLLPHAFLWMGSYNSTYLFGNEDTPPYLVACSHSSQCLNDIVHAMGASLCLFDLFFFPFLLPPMYGCMTGNGCVYATSSYSSLSVSVI